MHHIFFLIHNLIVRDNQLLYHYININVRYMLTLRIIPKTKSTGCDMPLLFVYLHGYVCASIHDCAQFGSGFVGGRSMVHGFVLKLVTGDTVKDKTVNASATQRANDV